MGCMQSTQPQETKPKTLTPAAVAKKSRSRSNELYGATETDQITVVTDFWKSIETIEPEQYDKLCESLYSNIFKLAPFAKALFKNSETRQGDIFFTKFTWIVKSLNHVRFDQVLSGLRKLGQFHTTLGVQKEHYPVVLEAFHETMSTMFSELYTARVRYCYTNLYEVIADIMTRSDFTHRRDEINKVNLASLEDVETCFEDERSAELLRLYMKQKFCSELYEFEVALKRLKETKSPQEFQRLKDEIYEKFLKEDAERKVIVSADAMQRFEEASLLENDEQAAVRLHLVEDEGKSMINKVAWQGFKNKVLKIKAKSLSRERSKDVLLEQDEEKVPL